MTFVIERTGPAPRRNRLVASEALTEQDFHEIAAELNQPIVKARKIGFIAARQVEHEETVVTVWNGRETTNVAEPGDWVVATLSPDRRVLRDGGGNANVHIVKAGRLPVLYEVSRGNNEFGQLFAPKAAVSAVFLSGGFDIAAPWGQRQISVGPGYLLLNGDEVYGNQKETFEATYQMIWHN